MRESKDSSSLHLWFLIKKIEIHTTVLHTLQEQKYRYNKNSTNFFANFHEVFILGNIKEKFRSLILYVDPIFLSKHVYMNSFTQKFLLISTNLIPVLEKPYYLKGIPFYFSKRCLLAS